MILRRAHLHDVCLVNDGHLLAAVLEGKVKGVLCDALSLGPCHNLCTSVWVSFGMVCSRMKDDADWPLPIVVLG